MTALQAVVFDFDGLIVDTEWSIYEMAATTFARFDHELTVPAWAAIVGLGGESDWWEQLCTTNGWQLDRTAWWAAYDAEDRSFRDTLPLQPGVADLVAELIAAGVPIGVASSSDDEWVSGHLTRLGIRDRFASVATVDRTGVGKPAPDLYLLACSELGVAPAAAVAIEDSRPGVMAAKAAGLTCVAVPSRITSHTDLSRADLSVTSVADLDLARLRTLVAAGG